ncbi:hypothetical protein N7456_010923 [Penicillium angulare]|uniref:Uncharacterized protein n=1 Tax=Penicillium angulare TaxID=116970 RepID=A0A9W9ESP2_9EURO|nr:hypothetical protein N7456_010923 [Penicillium angulare]
MTYRPDSALARRTTMGNQRLHSTPFDSVTGVGLQSRAPVYEVVCLAQTVDIHFANDEMLFARSYLE